jgi:hypothetical protein
LVDAGPDSITDIKIRMVFEGKDRATLEEGRLPKRTIFP